jgi:aminotransferase
MAGIGPSDIRRWTSIIESVGGVNLAQGNSFIEPSDEFGSLASAVNRAVHQGALVTGYNTYSHASGVPILREAIAKKCREFNRVDVDPDPSHGSVTVTQGATGGLICALNAIADPGDEIILFSPFYGYHLQSLRMLQLRPRVIPMHAPEWTLDFEEIESQINSKTKAILINTPHNPTGKVFITEELVQLCRICSKHGLRLISDEVYEFITYDDAKHISPASLPEAGNHVVTVCSFSKTLAITGWRLGYVLADPALTERIRIANEVLSVCAPTPLQHAIAPFVANWEGFLSLKHRFERKRSLLCSALCSAAIPHFVPTGAYYVLADLSHLGLPSDIDLNQHLVDQYRFAGVPGSAFYQDRIFTGLVRLCFAVPDCELESVNAKLTQQSTTDKVRVG